MAPEITPALLDQMMRDAQLRESDVERRLALARDPGYWRRLAPDAHIDSVPVMFESGSGTAAARRPALDEFHRDGILQVPAIVGRSDIIALNAIVERVMSGGWPPVFAFVYDELWSVARQPAIVDLVTTALGAGCSQVPHVWTHVVHTAQGAAGWAPHIDGPGNGRLSLWLALTSATLDNGCMHAVPASAVPPDAGEQLAAGNLTFKEVQTMLHEVRALPAAPGDLLGWTFGVIHWGGRARAGASEPRRAISLEFIATGEPPQDDERPLVALMGRLPPLDARLRAIAAGMLMYRKFEVGLFRYEPLAKRLREV